MIISVSRDFFRMASLLFALIVFTFPGTIRAQTVDIQQLLRELEQIRSSRANALKTGLRDQIESLSAAAASKPAAVQAYAKAVQAVEYEGKRKDAAEFGLWRDSNQEVLVDDTFCTALQLHLQYVVMSLKRMQGQKTEEVMPTLLDYVNRLSVHLSDLSKREKPKNDVQLRNEGARPKDKQGDKINKDVAAAVHDLMKNALPESVFVRWYGLDGYVANIEKWEQNSSNIEGIVDKTIMPYMREKKDPQLLDQWDARIARAEEKAKKTTLAIDLDKFQNQTLPSLMWSRAEDRILIGQRNAAILDMFNMVKTYQSHPDFEAWATELIALLKGENPAPLSSSKTAPVTASVPAPAIGD